MVKNPFIDYTDEELCSVIEDIRKSREDGKRAESLVPYAKAIKENINGSIEVITLRETLQMAKQDFYDVVCERFENKVNETRKQETHAKDEECKAYIHTYKCNEKDCFGCEYRM